jgi:hypothetical protein
VAKAAKGKSSTTPRVTTYFQLGRFIVAPLRYERESRRLLIRARNSKVET